MSVRPYDNCTLKLYRTSGMQTVADIRLRSRNNGRSGVAIEWCTSRLFTVYAKINNATPDSVTCLYMDVRAEFQSVIKRQTASIIYFRDTRFDKIRHSSFHANSVRLVSSYQHLDRTELEAKLRCACEDRGRTLYIISFSSDCVVRYCKVR